MGLLIDRINVREKAKYEQNTIKVLNNVVKPITTREYLVPNNTQKGRFFLCTFSWWFVDFSLNLHHHSKSYAKESKRKEWYGHLPRYAQGYQSSRYL